ncbi:MAG: hypothetical protein PWR17_295 [Candidatus Methanomethylophilaceae archaeon]|nr:hypothetical protein [Candidatus Methanomethylophilaceae archaeon]
MSDFSDRLGTLIEAKTPIIQIVSYETLRVYSEVKKLLKNGDKTPYVWNLYEGLRTWDKNNKEKTVDEGYNDASAVLEWFMDPDRNDTVLILEDFHPFLDIDRQPELISMLRSIYKRSVVGSGSNTLILLQPEMKIPSELEKEIQVLELPLPEEEEIRTLVKSVIDTFNIGPRDYDDNKRLIDAALGLTTGEVLSAFSCAAVKRKRLTVEEVPLIVAEKKQVISKRGNLEYYEPEQMMTDIGGLDNLKDWLDRRNKAFSQEAADFGLDAPRGIMLLGLPGTGKSLAAKAVANTWQMPLLRLDMGRIFGGIVGQSEGNMRAALNIAETIAPCVLWIDEIEKGMSGMQSSGATDGGTTSRVLGTFLTWMQEKKKPVFVVATANNISLLPPELLRKGRVDEIFFVDLPTKKERCEIINIHLNKRNRSLPENDVETIAEKSLGYTGAEIEEAIKDAMYRAFSEDRDITVGDILDSIGATTPLSRTMSEVISQTREWAKGRAVPASPETPEPLPEAKCAYVLKQERGNPFD